MFLSAAHGLTAPERAALRPATRGAASVEVLIVTLRWAPDNIWPTWR